MPLDGPVNAEALALLATVDLERLQELALEALARAAEAPGAALWIADERGALTLRGYRGSIDRTILPARLDPQALPRDALGLPLASDDQLLGFVRFAPGPHGAPLPEAREAAEALAQVAAVAVRNALRFEALQRIGLRDRETGAYNLAYFVDYAGKEFYKARRYGRSFALVVLSIDNAEPLRRAGGRDLYRRAMRELVGAVSRVVRDADVLAKVSESEYYLLLPETDPFGAQMFMRRAAEEIRGEPAIRLLQEKVPVLLSLGAGAFPRDGQDFDELLHRARVRVEAQRGSLARRLSLHELPRTAFWELCDLLLDGPGPIPETSASTRLEYDAEGFAAAQREVALELERDPRARGLVYLGAAAGDARAPLLSALPQGDGAARAGDASAQVFLLGSRGNEPTRSHPLATEVWLDGDPRLAGHQFLLHLSEQGGFAWLAGPGGQAFQTSDAPLVDELVQRLQALYDLQPV